MKILSYSKLTNNKYKIVFENNFSIVLFEEVILSNNILFKENLTIEEIRKYEFENSYYNSYYDALKFISKKMQSEEEIKIFLKKKDVLDKNINKIVNTFKKQNLIDDKRYASMYVNDKFNLSKKGNLKIKNELIKKGIDINVIENALSKIEYSDKISKINALIEKKLRLNCKYNGEVLKYRVLSELTLEGFEKDIVLECISNFDFNLDEDKKLHLKEKLLNRYNSKLSDTKLKQKVRNELSKFGIYD
ncbi:MAG: regulatory protein RecX [Bacilli bacterium]